MRILHVIGTFLPVRGGGPYYVHNLSTHLESKGHECRVVTTTVGGQADTETVPLTRSTAFEVGPAPIAPGFPVVLKRAIREFDPDVIHSNYPLPLYPDVAAVLSKFHSVPHVITCHGAFEMSWDNLVGAIGQVYNRTLLRVTLRLADRILVSNQNIVDEISLYQRYEDKLDVVPIGVDTEWFDPETTDGDPPFKIDDTKKTVLYAGAFRRYKSLDDLVRGFAQIVENHDVRLVLVGEGAKKADIESLVAKLGIEDSVVFPGFVSDEELRRAYAAADVFVLPSPTITESFGMVVMEAMAMGVPTVVTSGSGVGRVLDSEDAGVVVDPESPDQLADSIVRLVTDDEWYQKQADLGRTLVTERFAWTEIVDQNVAVYQQLLDDQF
ncbi:glycosyltransferase family 4 protein [Halomicrobium sp. IBSBa]|uniref:glycosyltransferase family 4 protein n=1 Tax=Halomicrobium sp. IBSBa TaxID=2778916 RepID=UPI001ABF6604|nr:glycosyltransferase family 4 protein [Halomicrobium sp. IBSBa]MBO4247088.1 glycosyltransferase family 4 protein [Halomicrobium sp. IBSBa]